jgi:4-aminobutyrate aminotransferase/(S)-3-amino-2-methylpropionate transaminase
LAAVRNQLELYTHTAFQVAAYEPYVRLAERLNAMAPIEGPAKTIFFTTGAEATENAVKIARAATRRPGIIAFSGGFHGRTLLSSALTGKVIPYKKRSGPFPPEIYHLPFPSDTIGVSVAQTLAALDCLFASDCEPERIAAFIVEPVLGEGGFHPASPELFSALTEFRRSHGILVIDDEVQTGFARTGRMFAIERFAFSPDLICVAKSLGGGLPISGVIGRAPLMDSIEPGGLGGTFGGPPLACAAANAVLDIIEEEGLLARAEAIGDRIRDRLNAFRTHPELVPISDSRGMGAMVAFDLVSSDGQAQPTQAKRVCSRALDLGLILLTCGKLGQAIRILVPLTVSDAVLDEGMHLLQLALERVDT